MTLSHLSRLCETMEKRTTAQQTRLIIQTAQSGSNLLNLLKIITLDLEPNYSSQNKTKRWICEHFKIFTEELDYYGDNLGSGIFNLETDKEKSSTYSLAQTIRLLELDCRILGSFDLFCEVLDDLSSLERKWFISFFTRKPYLRLDSKAVTISVLSKYFNIDKKQVSKDILMNELDVLFNSYLHNKRISNRATVGLFVPPMSSTNHTDWPTNHISEYKYGGIYTQIHKKGDTTIFFNRKGKILRLNCDFDLSFITKDCIIDAEIYCNNSAGTPSPYYDALAIMQKRTHAEGDKPLNLVILDCLYMGGCMMDQPFRKRLEALGDSDLLPTRSEENEEPKAYYNQSISEGFEGIYIRDLDAKYTPNSKSKSVIILNPPRIDLNLVVIGAKTDSQNNFSSFEIGCKSEYNFTSLGFVSGINKSEHRILSDKLRKLVSTVVDGKYTFIPRVVLNIKAEIIMKRNDRYSLRLPRIIAVRDDKYASDATTLHQVEQLVSGV